MASTVRTSYKIHARKARLAMRKKPRLSVGLASVVLASLWKLWRHYRLVKKRHKNEMTQLSDELHTVKSMLQEVTTEQKTILSTLKSTAQSQQESPPSDEVSRRLSRLEEDVACCLLRQTQAGRLSGIPSDPFPFESQPLLAEGPTSGPLPESLQFNLHRRGVPADALSSDQSMEIFQQAPPSSWDLMDLGDQAQGSQPYEKLLEEAQTSPKAHKVRSTSTEMLDLLGLPVPPSTPALPEPSSSSGYRGQNAAMPGPDNQSPAPQTPSVEQVPGIQEIRPHISVHLQRRRNLVTRQALRHNVLCAQEESREALNAPALEALSRAGEQLRRTEKLLCEAEETDEAALKLQHLAEPGAEKPAALRIAEHRAAKAKSACEAAYSRLCLAIDSAARQAAASPLQDSAPQNPISRSSSGKNLNAGRADAAASGELPSGIGPSRLGFRNGVAIQSQRAPSSGPPPNPPRHQRSSSVAAAAHGPSLERRSVGSDVAPSTGHSALQPSNVTRLERHKRSLSDTFDGSNSATRAGMPPAEPLGPKTSLGSIDTRDAEMEARNQALINELELRRLALHKS